MRGLRISFRMLLVPLLVVVLVAAWAAWWWLSGTLFRQFLDSFVAAERARGTEIHFTGPRLGGFPLGVHATFTDVAFSRPDGLSWQAPEVDVGVPLWQPGALQPPGRNRKRHRSYGAYVAGHVLACDPISSCQGSLQ